MPLIGIEEALREVREQADGIRHEMKRANQLQWSVLIAVTLVIAVISFAAFSVTLDNARAIDSNNQKICPLVLLLTPLPGDPAATTARMRQVSDRAVRLAQQFNCHIGELGK